MNDILIDIITNIVFPLLIIMGLLMELMIFVSVLANIQTIIDYKKMKGDKKNGFIRRHSRK